MKTSDHPIRAISTKDRLKDELYVELADLKERQLTLVLNFIAQILKCHDPDVVHDFLELHGDPTLGSILQIAASLGEEAREQLLFSAEELYATSSPRH